MAKTKTLPDPRVDARQVPDLVGRYVDCFYHGRRLARVRRVRNRHTLTVEFQATPGRYRLDWSSVVGVLWRNRIVPVTEWCMLREKRRAKGADGA